jgi:hypothetical protein
MQHSIYWPLGMMSTAQGFDPAGRWIFTDSLYTPDSWQQFSTKRR